MEIFGIIGMSVGSAGLVLAIIAMSKISSLEKQLKDKGILNKDFESE